MRNTKSNKLYALRQGFDFREEALPDPLYYSALSQSQQHAAEHNLTGLAVGALRAALQAGSGRAAEHEHWHRQLAQALFLQSEFDEAEAAVDRETEITRPERVTISKSAALYLGFISTQSL